MRTTLQILLAVRDCEPATDEELRLALCAMEGIQRFFESDLRRLAESITQGRKPTMLKFGALCAQMTLESMFTAMKTPPDKWLGPNHTPGTPENANEMRWAKGVLKAATGIDLDVVESNTQGETDA